MAALDWCVRAAGATGSFFGILNRLVSLGANKATPATISHAPAVLSASGGADGGGDKVRPGDKVIWGYWHSGRAALPGFCEFCVRTWEARNPTWKVVIIDEASLGAYLEAADLPSTFGSLKVQHQSDLVRIAVLRRFGGVYLDVSTVCLQGLDDVFEARDGPNLLLAGFNDGALHAEADNAAFRMPNNAALIARTPGDPVLAEWHRRVLRYVEAPCASVGEMEGQPAFARVRHLLRDQGLGVVKDSVCYMSILFLLFDLLAFDDDWTARVASGVGVLPTRAWTFSSLVLLAPPADGRVHWDLCTFLGRFVGYAKVRWFDEPERAKAILANVVLCKSSTDSFLELEKPPDFFARPSMDTTLTRVWRAAADPAAPTTQASLAGLLPGFPRGKKVIVGETPQ